MDKHILIMAAEAFWLEEDNWAQTHAKILDKLDQDGCSINPIPPDISVYPEDFPNQLTREIKLTPLHWAAAYGSLDQVPKDVLTVKNITHQGKGYTITLGARSGVIGQCTWTPLHLAARYGHLTQLPTEALTVEALTTNTSVGTPLHIAAEYGHLDQVPKEIFLNTKPPIFNGQNNTLRHNNPILAPDANNSTFLHRATWYSHLDQLPIAFLTSGNMLISGPSGESPLHSAASHGCLYQLPREVLSGHNLLIKATRGWTPLQSAIEHDTLDQVLGIDLPEEARGIVGEEWWKKNQKLLSEIEQQKSTLSQETSDSALDIY